MVMFVDDAVGSSTSQDFDDAVLIVVPIPINSHQSGHVSFFHNIQNVSVELLKICLRFIKNNENDFLF